MAASGQFFYDSNYGSTLKANFCPMCGGLLNLPSAKGMVSCDVCKHKCSVEELETKVIVMRATSKKDMTSSDAIGKAGHETTAAKMIDGSVLCPKCNHKELFFKTAQLRSADEGQTVFYECCKCGYTWSFHS